MARFSSIRGSVAAVAAALWGSYGAAQLPPPELGSPGGALHLIAGGADFLDAAGRYWQLDGPYLTTPTSVGFFEDEFDTVDVSLISDPDIPHGIFRSERWRDGDIAYRIPVANAPYKVFLYFAEMCKACVGPALGGNGCGACARVFDVQVESQRLDAYNQADAALPPDADGAGATWKATELVFDAAVADGFLDIRIIDRGAGNPPENASIKGMTIVHMPPELEVPGGSLRLNAGPGDVTDPIGRVWKRDDGFLATSGTSVAVSAGPVDASLLSDPHVPTEALQSERWKAGDIGYAIPARNGVYEVVLYFAETCAVCVGPILGGSGCGSCARIFDIEVEGRRRDSFNPADAALPPAGDGRGAARTAVELVFYAGLGDEFLDIRLLDRGAGNPPENPAIKAMVITRLDARVLGLGAPASAALTPADPGDLFLLEASAGSLVVLSAAVADPLDAASLYVRWNGLPDRAHHDLASISISGIPPCVLIPGLRADACLVLVQADRFNGPSAGAEVSAEAHGLYLKSLRPRAVGLGSTGVSAVISGLGFGPGTSFTLAPRGGGPGYSAAETVIQSGARAECVFDLSAAPAGAYDLLAAKQKGELTLRASLENAFDVRRTRREETIVFELKGFGAYRPGEISRLTLRYRNMGDQEIPAPLFKVEGPPGVELGLRSDDAPSAGALQVLGIDPGGVAGRLSPDAEWREVHVYFRAGAPGPIEISMSLFSPGPMDPIPWDALEAPPGLTRVQWESLRTGLAERMGATWKEYQESLAGIATRLHRRGEDASNVGTLFRFAAREAVGRPTSGIVGRLRDAASGAPLKDVVVVARRAGANESSARSDRDGHFTLDWLRAGATYTLAAVDFAFSAPALALPATGDILGLAFDARREENGIVESCPGCGGAGLPSGPITLPQALSGERVVHLLEEIRSRDPNEKRGPRKPEMNGMEDRVCPGEEMEYQVRFENTGSAPARVIQVLDRFDAAVFDLYSFRFTEIILPQESYPLTTVERDGLLVPLADDFGVSELIEDASPTGEFCVAVNCAYDPIEGCLDCTLRAVDPLTGGPPIDPTVGLLEQGEWGSISFAVSPESGGDLEEGTEIKNKGEIVFDDNPPVSTNVFVNTFSQCPELPFRRADVNADGRQDISDGIFTLAFLFLGRASPLCMKTMDMDDDGRLIITDPIFFLNHLFLGGPAPPPPYTSCGIDPRPDDLGCGAFPPCP